jgi:putative hydrolase of the HAD superfamily
MVLTSPIRAVVFDLGGTLEDVRYDDAIRAAGAADLLRFMVGRSIDPGLSAPELQNAVLAGMRAYSQWKERSGLELPPEQVWTKYVLADCGLPEETVAAAAEDLTFLYETRFHTRTVRPGAAAVLAALATQGYRLAVISNIISRQLVPMKLAEYGLAPFFDAVMTSATFGWRKPDPRIFAATAQKLGLAPAACAYVGDTVSRDVIGAHRAGYGLAILIRSFLTDELDRETDTDLPDLVIQDLMEVVAAVHPSAALR